MSAGLGYLAATGRCRKFGAGKKQAPPRGSDVVVNVRRALRATNLPDRPTIPIGRTQGTFTSCFATRIGALVYVMCAAPTARGECHDRPVFDGPVDRPDNLRRASGYEAESPVGVVRATEAIATEARAIEGTRTCAETVCDRPGGAPRHPPLMSAPTHASARLAPKV